MGGRDSSNEENVGVHIRVWEFMGLSFGFFAKILWWSFVSYCMIFSYCHILYNNSTAMNSLCCLHLNDIFHDFTQSANKAILARKKSTTHLFHWPPWAYTMFSSIKLHLSYLIVSFIYPFWPHQSSSKISFIYSMLKNIIYIPLFHRTTNYTIKHINITLYTTYSWSRTPQIDQLLQQFYPNKQ